MVILVSGLLVKRMYVSLMNIRNWALLGHYWALIGIGVCNNFGQQFIS